jgi:hypothetical protein
MNLTVLIECMRWRRWLRQSATRWTVPCSTPDGVIVLFLFTYIFRLHFGSTVESVSDRNEADNFASRLRHCVTTRVAAGSIPVVSL